MVQSKAERQLQKLVADKCQSLIEVLLKDEDNKYCVDCDAKGPRWASWNLGVFLCIRCAGIHRNLGVHISKVKSVNLDAWTPEHVAYVDRMGNKRARAIYEANLPDDFRRPQTDTALESFIRAKYEHKKYIAQGYVDPGPPAIAFNIDEELKKMKEQKRSKFTGSGNMRMISVTDLPSNAKPRPTETSGLKNKVKATPGLVDLETVAATEAAGKPSNNSALDLLIGVDLESPNAGVGVDPTPSSQKSAEFSQGLAAFSETSMPIYSNNSINLDLDFTSSPASEASKSNTANNVKKVLTKESILSLYSASPSTSATPGAGLLGTATDPFGMNTSSDPFKASSGAGNFNSTLISLSATPTNIPAQNLSGLTSISAASGLTSLLGSNSNNINNNSSLIGPSQGADQLLAPFGNQLVVGGGTSSSSGGSNSHKFPKTKSPTVKNSSLDELFAGLDILHPKSN